MRENVIEVDGRLVHYLEDGCQNGRPLLLLAGGIGDACSDWLYVLPQLAETFHVFAPDLPGFSGSAALPEMGVPRLIDWLRAFLDALGQTEVVIIAHSLGAVLARLFAAQQPEYVPALILTNGGTFPHVPSLVRKLLTLPLIGGIAFELIGQIACRRHALDNLLYVHEALSEGLLKAWRSNALGFAYLMRALLISPRDGKSTPPVPTLLLWGANDSMLTLAHAQRLLQEIPGSVLEPIADCGHLPPLEASDAFVFQVEAFLKRLSQPTQPSLPGAGLLRPNPA
ncbi:MAG TPA: alpha/beta hydrolase [Phototrophicaceae bacterium]|nr:alpha/beta hydrolase [Phototrophicaceae bacterium]